MVREALTRLRWEAARQGAQLGWLGAASLVAVVAASVFHISVVKVIEHESEALRDEASQLRRRHQMSLTQPATSRPGAAAQLGTFYEFFPPQETLPDGLAKVYAAAKQRGVALERGEYKVTQERGWRLLRYQITLPVKGTYEQIRGFVGDALGAVPASAIDEISLKRDGIGTTLLEAQIKLTLFVSIGDP